MAVELLKPPSTLSPPEALHLAQKAPSYLRSSWNLPYPLNFLFTSDAPEKWQIYENLFYSCLRTGDDRSAALCLKAIKDRFGDGNEKVMGLMGTYHEAVASKDGALDNYLMQYTEAVEDKPTNMVIRKRKIALLRSMGKSQEAVTALVELLNMSPVDAESWAELADLYFVQGKYAQAIFSLEEVLLITPNAWNIHARLAETLYISAVTAKENSINYTQMLTRSMKTFCRSVELCDDYLRGYYGIKLSTSALKEYLGRAGSGSTVSKDTATPDFPPPNLSTVQKLNELATAKLGEIIRRHSTKEKGWEGYDEAEIIAARALLDQK